MSGSSVPSNTPARFLPVREIAVVGLIALALFVTLAIASYSPQDSGFSYSSAASQTNNLVGPAGAYFSSLILYLLGWVAYILPFCLLVVGLRLIFAERAALNWLFGLVRTTGWL